MSDKSKEKGHSYRPFMFKTHSEHVTIWRGEKNLVLVLIFSYVYPKWAQWCW